MNAGELDPDRAPLPWCVVWAPIEGGPSDGLVVARFMERGDAETWIAVTAHACEVATRCGVLGDIRVVLAYDGEEVDRDAE